MAAPINLPDRDPTPRAQRTSTTGKIPVVRESIVDTEEPDAELDELADQPRPRPREASIASAGGKAAGVVVAGILRAVLGEAAFARLTKLAVAAGGCGFLAVYAPGWLGHEPTMAEWAEMREDVAAVQAAHEAEELAKAEAARAREAHDADLERRVAELESGQVAAEARAHENEFIGVVTNRLTLARLDQIADTLGIKPEDRDQLPDTVLRHYASIEDEHEARERARAQADAVAAEEAIRKQRERRGTTPRP